MQQPNKEDIKAILTDPDAWLAKHAKDTSVFKDLAAQSTQASSETLLDYDAIEREGDWNALATQIVGRELSS